jgi:hypothetical protein
MFSLAPRGFDAASIALFSASDMGLFERVYCGLEDILSNDSARVATLFAAARILRLMETKAYASMRAYETNLRTAVNIVTQSGVR